MDSDSILASPNGIFPAEIMIQVVEDYFAFRNAEIKADCRDYECCEFRCTPQV